MLTNVDDPGALLRQHQLACCTITVLAIFRSDWRGPTLRTKMPLGQRMASYSADKRSHNGVQCSVVTCIGAVRVRYQLPCVPPQFVPQYQMAPRGVFCGQQTLDTLQTKRKGHRVRRA